MNKKYNYEDVFIHDSSFIDDNVEIGPGTKIWHFSHILKDCKIGNDCSFGQNVVVGQSVTIGNKVKIQNNVSVYEGVTLEDGVFCGPSCVFTNVNNPRSEIVRKNEFRKTLVKRGATLGANCTIVCGVTIGAFAFIGAGAVISKDVPSYALMVGVPAKQVGWMSEYGEKLDLPLIGNAKTICKHTNQKYQLKDGQVTIID
jgi:UDP-2-acetamido-3-amino-2,3-dideoxy-glucuronate N-acetyltransferase